jgi:hypothetical protein
VSAATIPYHLRPHKAVDRRLFIDLLNRCERWRPLIRDAYLSMGAYPLEDHKLVHRMIGITRLIAFDDDPNIVARQRFNRPVDSFRAFKMKSGELIAELDQVLQEAECGDPEGLIIWLDYTAPKQLGEQVREFEALLDKVKKGDIVRVTVNAHLPALGDSKGPDGKNIPSDQLRVNRFGKLKERIGDYLPSDAKASDMTPERLPVLIAQAFGKAAAKALPVSGQNAFVPLSVVRYSDGQQMLSMTGMVVPRTQKTDLRNKLDMSSYPFFSDEWKDVHFLEVPDLTLRERLFLERAASTSNCEEVAENLGFAFSDDMDIGVFLNNYKEFYRFYPTLLSAEV